MDYMSQPVETKGKTSPRVRREREREEWPHGRQETHP